MSNPFTEEWLAERNARIFGQPTTPAVDAGSLPDVPEALIEAECTKILEEDGWRALRTDPVSDKGRGKGFGEPGMADHYYWRPAPERNHYGDPKQAGYPCVVLALSQTMWIEFKRPGEKAKKHQTAWHIRERARGALTLIAGDDFPASVEGFRNWYAGSGLKRA